MKRGVNFKMSNTVFSVSFAVICLRIGTQMASKRPLPPPPVQNETARELHRQTKFHKACSNSVIEFFSDHHTLEIVLKDRKLFRKD